MNSISFFREIDKYIGAVIIGILNLFLKWNKSGSYNHNESPKQILIVKLWAIGESVLTLPFINSIKKNYPGAIITVLARKNNYIVYKNAGDVERVILFEPGHLFKIFSHFRYYDISIDAEPYFNISAILSFWLAKRRIGFSHGVRSSLYTDTVDYSADQHAVKEYLNLASVINKQSIHYDRLIKLNFTTQDKEYIEDLLKEEKKGDNFWVAIAPGSGLSGEERRWPLNHYQQLIANILENDSYLIFLIGSRLEEGLCEKIIRSVSKTQSNNNGRIINLAGKSNLSQLFYLMTKFDLFIGNDSGPMHIASAQGVKTIGIFGPNMPVRFAPYGPDNAYLYKRQWCSPCINVHLGKIPPCFNTVKGKCMKEISPQDVYLKVKQLLNIL